MTKDDLFTVISVDVFTPLFEGPAFSLPTEENSSIDLLEKLEVDRDAILDELGKDREAFLAWYRSSNRIEIKVTIKILELLVTCWLASKEYNKNNAI